jgi:hypothetical protein
MLNGPVLRLAFCFLACSPPMPPPYSAQ